MLSFGRSRQVILIVFLGRDPGTLKSDIVSEKYPQLVCSDLRLKLKIRRLKLWKPTVCHEKCVRCYSVT